MSDQNELPGKYRVNYGTKDALKSNLLEREIGFCTADNQCYIKGIAKNPGEEAPLLPMGSGGGSGDSDIFIGTVESTFDDYANAVLDGKLIYLRSPAPMIGAPFEGADLLWEGPRICMKNWSDFYPTRAAAIQALRNTYTELLSWEFTTDVSALIATASERFSIVMDVETSILHPKYLYALLFPELAMDYSDEDGLSSDFLIPLHYNENTDEVEEYPEGLRACMIILHQRGIPIMLGMHAGEVEDFTYVLSLEYLGENYYGRWGFRLREVISVGGHLPFVGEYCLGVSWDAGEEKNILTPLTNTPLFSPRYMPITMETPWSTLSEIFGLGATLAGTTYEGVFMHISAPGGGMTIGLRFEGYNMGGGPFTGDFEFIVFEADCIRQLLFYKNGNDDSFLITYLNKSWTLDDDDEAYAEYYTNDVFYLKHKGYRLLIWGDGTTNDVPLVIQAVLPGGMSFEGRIYCTNRNSSPVHLVMSGSQDYVEIPNGSYQVDIVATMQDNTSTYISVHPVAQHTTPEISVTRPK